MNSFKKKAPFFLGLLALSFLAVSLAKGEEASTTQQTPLVFQENYVLKRPQEPISWLDVDVGVYFGSTVVHRGATLYKKPLIWPFPVLRFLDDRILLSSDKVLAQSRWWKRMQFFGGVSLFEDHAILRLFGDQEVFRQSRKTSFEFFGGVKFRHDPVLLGVSFFQDLNSHKGQFVRLDSRVDLWKGSLNSSVRSIVFVDGAVGLGSEKHNEYLYGPGGETGLASWQAGLGMEIFDVFPSTYVSLTFLGTGVLGSANRSGSLVADQKDSLVGTLTFAYRLPI